MASIAVTNVAIATLSANLLSRTSENIKFRVRQELEKYFTPQGSLADKRYERAKLPWTLAIIYETLRLSPPAPFFREKRAPPCGDPKYGIPRNTSIG